MCVCACVDVVDSHAYRGVSYVLMYVDQKVRLSVELEATWYSNGLSLPGAVDSTHANMIIR